MILETSPTPWSDDEKDNEDIDERRFRLIDNLEFEDDDFVVIQKIEQDGSELIEKLQDEDVKIRDHDKKVKREARVALDPELKDELLPYFFVKPTDRTCTSYQAKRLFENRHGNQTNRTASDTESFDFRGCPDVESKINKVKRVYEEKDFESFESLIERAKDVFKDKFQELVEEDNRKLKEQIVRSYKEISDPLEDFPEEAFPDIRETIERLESEIESINKEIQKQVGHLKETRSEAKSKIKDLKNKMLEEEVNNLKNNGLVPDDEFAEELMEAMRSKQRHPFS